jgi:hypothetical protein
VVRILRNTDYWPATWRAHILEQSNGNTLEVAQKDLEEFINGEMTDQCSLMSRTEQSSWSYGEPKENCGIKSRKTECPFRLKFSYNKQEGVYRLLPGSILDHNHPPDDVACFWQYRRLTPTMYACAIDMIS